MERSIAAGSIFIFAAATMMLGGCAANRALDQPAHKDLGVLTPGTNRDVVRSELGAPMTSVVHDDCDVFSFPEGSSGWKYIRAMGYSLLDIGTLGLSEVVTNPAEAGVGNDKVRLRVCYDARQDVAYSERLDVGERPRLLTGVYPPPSPVLPAPQPPAVTTASLPPANATGVEPAVTTPVTESVPPASDGSASPPMHEAVASAQVSIPAATATTATQVQPAPPPASVPAEPPAPAELGPDGKRYAQEPAPVMTGP